MRLARLRIESFRRIDALELDFTDALGRVRDVTLLVAPNGAGKTTILDAVAAAVGPSTELPALRNGLTLSPARIVRKGATRAKVTCQLRFTADEIETARAVQEQVEKVFPEKKKRPPVPDAREVELTWTYPHPKGKLGFSQTDPPDAWTLLKTRVRVARLLQNQRGDAAWFTRAGQVVTIDQQRTSLSRTIRRDIWEIIQGRDVNGSDRDTDRRTSDPRTILLELAVRAGLPRRGGGKADDAFALVQESYATVCSPRKIIGAVQDEGGRLDLQLSDGTNEYGYDGVSSGEAMVLLFLTKLVSERVHSSIVLVDEIELHQHPVWQGRLLHILPRIGDKNQIIATTHSEYLRDLVPRDALKDATQSDVGGIELEPLQDVDPGAHA